MPENILYTADEVAALLGLHVRTVRNYVRDGRLPAVKIGKQYRIASEDVAALTGGRGVAKPADPAGRDTKVEATTIVQVEGIDETNRQRLTTLVTASATTRPGDTSQLHIETASNPQRQALKIVIIGSPTDTAAVLELIGAFTESEL